MPNQICSGITFRVIDLTNKRTSKIQPIINSVALIHKGFHSFPADTKYRKALIHHEWRERLYEYITGIFQSNRHKMLQINSMPDHIHIFIGLRPHQSISALIQNVKKESSKCQPVYSRQTGINKQKFCAHSFEWQDGYGAFSYAKSQVDNVTRYIQNQEIHHRKETFLDEDRKFLTVFEIEWEEKWIRFILWRINRLFFL